jgi:hypothetical protein
MPHQLYCGSKGLINSTVYRKFSSEEARLQLLKCTRHSQLHTLQATLPLEALSMKAPAQQPR